MNCVLLKEGEIDGRGRVCLDDYRARHALEILKAEPGRTIRIGVIDGPRGEGTVIETGESSITLECSLEKSIPKRPGIDVILALPRPKVMVRLWGALVSMGVDNVVLTGAAKVEKNYFATHWLEREHYEPLIIEGLEQSGDTRFPKVSIQRNLRQFLRNDLEDALPDGERIVMHPRYGVSLSSLIDSSTERVLLAVGPEGGWEKGELDLMQEQGFTVASMGWRTLKTETACIAMLAITRELMKREI